MLFFREIRFDFLCELSAGQKIHIKCHVLYSHEICMKLIFAKQYRSKSEISSIVVVISALRVKMNNIFIPIINYIMKRAVSHSSNSECHQH